MQGPGTGACDSGTLRQDDEQGITRLLPTAAHAAALTSALPRPTMVEMPTDGGGEVCAAPPPPGEEPVPQPCPATFPCMTRAPQAELRTCSCLARIYGVLQAPVT